MAIVVVLVVLAGGGLALFRVLHGNSGLAKAPDGSLPGGGLTQSPNAPNGGAPFTQSPNPPGGGSGLTQSNQPMGLTPAPPGTDDYLRWLRQKESERQRIYGDMQHAIQMAATQAGVDWAKGMEGLTNPTGEGDVEQARRNVRKQTNAVDEQVDRLDALAAEFTRKVPPESCRRVHEQYSGMMQKWAGYMKKVQRAIANADLNDLPAGGGADREIEDAIAQSDQELGAVYGKYAIADPPRFRIEDKGAATSSPFTSGG